MPYHGDVKPENVLTDRSQRVRLIDPASAFGREKGSNQRVLTPLYNPWFDKSDVAAFGLTLVEALTGKQLLACASRNRPLNKLGPRLTQSVAAAEGMGRSRYLAYLQWMPMPTELQPDFPEPLEQLALRCLRLERTGGGLELADPPRRLGVIARELRRIGG
jgi:serine/threonine protein kinase